MVEDTHSPNTWKVEAEIEKDVQGHCQLYREFETQDTWNFVNDSNDSKQNKNKFKKI